MFLILWSTTQPMLSIDPPVLLAAPSSFNCAARLPRFWKTSSSFVTCTVTATGANVWSLCHCVPDSSLPLRQCRSFHMPALFAAGGIPTGLFVHLDPDPVLTTLCVAFRSECSKIVFLLVSVSPQVMASEDHVRDPSLRGRAAWALKTLKGVHLQNSWHQQR